jgi:hypothetical protein
MAGNASKIPQKVFAAEKPRDSMKSIFRILPIIPLLALTAIGRKSKHCKMQGVLREGRGSKNEGDAKSGLGFKTNCTTGKRFI